MGLRFGGLSFTTEENFIIFIIWRSPLLCRRNTPHRLLRKQGGGIGGVGGQMEWKEEEEPP